MIVATNTYNTSPPRIIIHGGEGVGKSTFCSQARRPAFFPCEEGLKGLRAVKLVTNGKDRLETYEEFLNALTYFENNAASFDTAVIDSGDWLEQLIHDKVCRDSKKNNIAEAGGGYGKGYLIALDLWQSVLIRLDKLNKMRKWVIIILHSKSVLFNDPLTEPYDQWTIKLHSPKGQNGSLELLKEWADVICFAAVERFVRETATTKAQDKGEKLYRAMETGNRVLHLEPTSAFLAKNRYGLKGDCNLTWPAFMQKFVEAAQA